MTEIKPLQRLTVPLGGQEIELQTVTFDASGTEFLRVRIREGRRFTVFDIDPASAATWASAMGQWAASRQGGNP
jgi:hypothetical protein